MRIEIKRFARYHKAVHGRMRIDGEPVCDTLENADNRLPVGVYNLTMKKWKGFKRKHIVIGDRSCVFDHNGPYRLQDGGISVGECHYLGFLIHCQQYLEPLMERVRMALRRHQNITVIIREDGDGNRGNLF